MASLSLAELQKSLWEERNKVLQGVLDEAARADIQEKIDEIYEKYQEIDDLLREYSTMTNAEKAEFHRRKNAAGNRNTSSVIYRTKVNPIFQNVGIEPPIGQRKGDPVVSIGQPPLKLKTHGGRRNRKTLRRRKTST